jgi:hypothetical protein
MHHVFRKTINVIKNMNNAGGRDSQSFSKRIQVSRNLEERAR